MIAIIGGEEKTGKTTFAMTFPKPMLYLELDIGGFDRAKHRFSKEELEQVSLIQFPNTALLELLEFKNKSATDTLLIKGEKERWLKFISAFNNGCMDKGIKTIVMDTWYQVYELVRQAYLQTLQEAQLDEYGKLKKGETKLRETLQQIEYTQPYARIRSLMFYAKAMGKNLVLVTYDADEYKPQLGDDGKIRDARTGKKILAGWKETEKHADIALWCKVTDGKPVANITLPGLAPLEAVGAELPDSSYQSLIKVLNFYGVESE